MKEGIIVKEVGKKPEIRGVDIKNLDQLQAIVGGQLQTVLMPGNILMVVNKEGMILDLPFNFHFMGENLHGNVFFCSEDEEGFTGLSESQGKWLYGFLEDVMEASAYEELLLAEIMSNKTF